MPKVTRSRVIDVSPERVWEVVADPHHLPRWWPRTVRVEDVRSEDGRPMHWTTVLGTDSGTRVRADFRRVSPEEPRRFSWAQELAGTPFERILRSAEVGIAVEAASDAATRVTVISAERLRGLSRLGSPMMRAAAGRRLDEALGNLDRVLAGGA